MLKRIGCIKASGLLTFFLLQVFICLKLYLLVKSFEVIYTRIFQNILSNIQNMMDDIITVENVGILNIATFSTILDTDIPCDASTRDA